MTQEEKEEYIKSSELFGYEIINDNIVIGAYKVMFGYRIRGGYIGSYSFDFDICCGTNQYNMILVHMVYAAKIRQNISENLNPFTGLKSICEPKPIHVNTDYMTWLLELKQELGISI